MSDVRTQLTIEPVDPYDDAAVAAWHAVFAEAESFGHEAFATVWQLEEMRVMLQDAGTRTAVRAWSGREGERVVVTGYVRTPLRDNLERAELAVHVLPAERRRGLGRAMAVRLEEEARALGRTVLGAEVQWPPGGGSDGVGEPGPDFARALGFELALSDVQRELALPVPPGVLEALAAEAAPYHSAYRLRSFVGAIPDDLVAAWVQLSGSVGVEAPTGDLQIEPETITVQEQRDAEEVIRKQGRTKYNTVALDPTGEVVAFTDLATTVHEPGRAYQWGTLVRRDHRGRRLGLAVKVANLQLLQRERPDVTRLITWNAEENSHMVAVNERMGFVPVARLGEFQKLA